MTSSPGSFAQGGPHRTRTLRVVRELDRLIGERGKPTMVVSDNGTELTSNAILIWADDHRIDWHYVAPGKPMQNGFIDSLNDGNRFRGRRRDSRHPLRVEKWPKESR